MNARPYIKLHTTGLLLCLLAPLLLLGGFSLAQDARKPVKPETAGQKFKNIKVLKNLPADHLIPLMQAFDASLGVKCDACHAVNPDHTGFEKDDKKMKQTARTMILLVGDLNLHQKALKGKVTCFLCHHGSQEPQFHPASMGQPSQ